MASSRINQKSEELKTLWEIIFEKVGKPRNLGANNDVYNSFGRDITSYVTNRKKENEKIKNITTESLYEYRKVMQLLNKEEYRGKNGEYRSFSYPILNTLAIAGGFDSWDDYMQQKWPNKYNDFLSEPNDNSSILYFDIKPYEDVSQIQKDTEIILGWYPKRYIKLLYLGDFKFRVLAKNGITYNKEVFLHAQKFSLDLTEDIDLGYPMHPNIFAIYKGDTYLINFDKKIKS